MKYQESKKFILPQGYKAATCFAGLKQEGPDMLLLTSDQLADCAAAFTSNTVKAAPVLDAQDRLKKSDNKLKALLVNSGNANAATGEQGRKDVKSCLEAVSSKLGLPEEQVLMCSTGIIGEPLPMEKLGFGIDTLSEQLSAEASGEDCALSIMTTDTQPKGRSIVLEFAGHSVRLSGIAKGSGMIAPNMATMLAFIVSDVSIDPKLLKAMSSRVINDSFNLITVDGDMSTNDAVLVLANGQAGNACIEENSSEAAFFEEALLWLMGQLAKDIVQDGEGATKFIEIQVLRAICQQEAKEVCLAIANSALVKTAMFGEDPNWGRIIAAAGKTAAQFDPEQMDLDINGFALLKDGNPCLSDPQALAESMKQKNIQIVLNLKAGDGAHRVWTSDLSYDYVKINAEYHT